MKNHPYSEIFPLLDGGPFEELVADVKTHGLREPIITYRGEILDGRNRFLACQKANVKPIFTAYAGTDEGALAWVISANIHRRHLNESQRAMAGAEIARILGKSETPGPIGPRNSTPTHANDEAAAKAVNVSPRSIRRARKVSEKGSKELKEAVKAGKVRVSKAAKVAELPKTEQLAAAKAKPERDAPTELESDAPEKPTEDEESEAMQRAEQDWRERMDKVLGADDKLAEMAKQLKQTQDELSAAKQARDRYMNQNAALLRQNKALQRKLDRLEKKAA